MSGRKMHKPEHLATGQFLWWRIGSTTNYLSAAGLAGAQEEIVKNQTGCNSWLTFSHRAPLQLHGC